MIKVEDATEKVATACFDHHNNKKLGETALCYLETSLRIKL